MLLASVCGASQRTRASRPWSRLLGVRVARIHRPVVLGDARPEQPDQDHGDQGEESLEQGAVDRARGAVANVRADDKVEDLSQCEGNGRAGEVDHRPSLAEDPQDEDGLQRQVEHDPQERKEQVQDVERKVPVRELVLARVPEAGEGEAGVEGDVADADEEGKCRAGKEADREGSPVVHQLVADDAIEKQDPRGGRNGANVDGAESLSCRSID